MRQPHLVLVYGTLKRGFPNHDETLLGDRFMRVVRSVIPYPMVVAGRWFSPVVLPEPGQGLCISGELYGVDNTVLEQLDIFEGVGRPHGYHRYKIDVESDLGEVHSAWCYMKDRNMLGTIHTDFLTDYQDRRYVPRGQRPLVKPAIR